MAYQYQQMQHAAAAYQNGYPHSGMYNHATPNGAFSPTFQTGYPQYPQQHRQGFEHLQQQQQRQIHQQQAYQSPYTRRDSINFHVGRASISSTAASTPPAATWGSPSLQEPYVGTPSPSQPLVTGRYGQQLHYNPATAVASYSPYSMTPTKGPLSQMSAVAPAFTPSGGRAASPFSQSGVARDHQNQVGDGLEQEARFMPGRRGSLPRFHRTAPSLATSHLGSNDDVRRGGLTAGTSPSKSLPRSPLASRGVSPVGSNFSIGTDNAPLLNAFGLPISKPRIYKVKFPLEVEVHGLDADTRKQSRWRRKPLSQDLNNDEGHDSFVDFFSQEVRCKSPHPGDRIQPDELPESLEIYLPNDWTTLRQALFEERMAKIGIDKDYLRNMDARLSAMGHALPINQAPTQAHAHARSGSVSATPQSRNLDLELHSPVPVLPPSIFRKSHAAALSLALPSATPFASKPSGFLRQQPPFGPRDIPPSLSRAASANIGLGLPAPVEEADEEEEQAEVKGRDLSPPHAEELLPPAKSLSFKELAAGFGINSSDEEEAEEEEEEQEGLNAADEASSPRAPADATVQQHSGVIVDGRVAVEGLKGHHSLPSSASLVDNIEGGPSMPTLDLPYNPRRSVSAPDLHEKLASVFRSATTRGSEGGYTAEEEEDDKDNTSIAETEYSNPSDEEKAKFRRDEGLRRHESVPTVHKKVENWMDRGESEDVVSNPSDEEGSSARPLPWSLAHDTLPPTEIQHRQFAPLEEATLTPGPRPSVLNANAPSFVFGGEPTFAPPRDSSDSSSFSYEGGKLTLGDARVVAMEVKRRSTEVTKAALNVAAPVFKPSLPTKANGFSADAEEFKPLEAALDDKLKTNLKAVNGLPSDSTEQVEIWLSDVTTPGPVATPQYQTVAGLASGDAGDVVGEAMSVDHMRTFKFPPSPHLRPVSPLLQPSPISTVAPQIPPLGVVDGNTFQNALGDFSLVQSMAAASNKKALETRVPSTRSRPPIPSFEPPSGESPLYAKHPAELVPLSPVTPLHPEPTSNLPVSEFGSDVLPPTNNGLAAVHVENDETASDKDPDPNAISHSETDSESSVSLSGSVPSSIARAYQQSPASRSSLARSWKIFEAILDRKLDVLRNDVFAHSTPLPPPPLSAEAQEALAAAVVEAVRDEMPLRPIPDALVGIRTAESAISQPLMEAIHDTQTMLQEFRGRSDNSVKDLIEMLNTRLSDAPETALPDVTTLAARIVDGVNAELAARAQTLPDLEQLTLRLADAVKPQLYALIDLAGDKKETAALVVDQLEPRLQVIVKDQIQSLAGARDHANRAQDANITDTVHRAVFACIPDLVQSLLPTMVPVPESPAANVGDVVSMLETQMQLHKTAMSQLQTLEHRISESYVKLGDSQMIQQTMSELRCNNERLQGELDLQRRHGDADRAKSANEIQYLRTIIGNKDKQLEVVRQELLNRAILMDQEAKEKDQEHARRVNEMEALRGGMQTELAILRSHAKESASTREELQQQLDKTRQQLFSLDKQHHTELSLVAEREAAARERQKGYEQREQQHTAQLAKLQEILGEEASHRIRLEDRITKAQTQVEKLGEEKSQLEQVVQSLRTQLADEKARSGSAASLQAAREVHFEVAARQAASEIEHLQQANHQLAVMTEQSTRSMLSYILSNDVGAHKYPFPSDLVFETCIAAGVQEGEEPVEALDDHATNALDTTPDKVEKGPVIVRVEEASSSDLELSEDDDATPGVVDNKPVVIDDSGWFT